jgi:2'-5' RNA ligase
VNGGTCMARVFFGVELEPFVKERLRDVQVACRRAGVQARWTDPQLFHMTVLFLGELSEEQVVHASRVAAEVATQFPPQTLSLTSVGAFHRNGILWAGIDSAEEARFGDIQRTLADALRGELGLRTETRPFRAHITLARRLDSTSYQSSEAQLHDCVPTVQSTVRELVLFESTRRDGRLMYPVRQRLAFTGGR